MLSKQRLKAGYTVPALSGGDSFQVWGSKKQWKKIVLEEDSVHAK